MPDTALTAVLDFVRSPADPVLLKSSISFQYQHCMETENILVCSASWLMLGDLPAR